MIDSQKTRVSKLEERRAVSDLKTDYCPCRCHWKSIDDFMEIPDEKLIELAEIVESAEPFQLPDGTWRTRAEDLEERISNSPSCTCNCKH